MRVFGGPAGLSGISLEMARKHSTVGRNRLWRSKSLLGPALSRLWARNRCSGLLGAPCSAPNRCTTLLGTVRGAKSLLRPARKPPVALETLLGLARSHRCSCHLLTAAFTIRSRHSRLLGSVPLLSVPLNSAPPCSVHGYAQVHTSIHAYTYKYINNL